MSDRDFVIWILSIIDKNSTPPSQEMWDTVREESRKHILYFGTGHFYQNIANTFPNFSDFSDLSALIKYSGGSLPLRDSMVDFDNLKNRPSVFYFSD